MDENKLRNMILRLTQLGYQVTPDAFDMIRSMDPSRLECSLDRIKDIARDGWITRAILEEVLGEPRSSGVEVSISITAARQIIEGRVEIVRDPSMEVKKGITIRHFHKLFVDRFDKLGRLIKMRSGWNTVTSIEAALEAKQGEEVKVIGMVMEKKIADRYIGILLDDLDSTVKVIVPFDNPELKAKGEQILLDQVIGVAGIRGRRDTIIAKEIVFPDIPPRKSRRSDEEVYAALISDLHTGSRLFLKDRFEKFIRWIKGDVYIEELDRVRSKLKYMVIAGDIVDGIGVYPNQERELEIRDINRQYEVALNMIKEVPSSIEVIVIPGNHDATDKTQPQPPPTRYIKGYIDGCGNIHVVGNPVWIKIHGVELLVYHGRSLDSVIASIPGFNANRVDEAMEILLRARHLTPTYNDNSPITPASTDTLIIEEIPDIFHAGHVHIEKQRYYKGVLIVNSGAWQAQTNYQKLNGITPTPAIIPIVDLSTLNVKLVDFS
ncbi:MAG: DNA-directed DNA polymerase II small subunit [Candidatus Bathyarchaeota archaeon]|nr:DNA-directed DNA polymerase II small subunit [Candidatus Bathyarchaeota archaeon]